MSRAPASVLGYDPDSENAAHVRAAIQTQVAPLAVTPIEAASMLSMSRDSFDRYVRDEIRVVRRGRLVLVPVSELARWLDCSAARTLDRDAP
jgi:hypothetical protein